MSRSSSAQTEHRSRSNAFRASLTAYDRLFGIPDTYVVLGAGLVGSLAVMPFDDDIRDSSFNTNNPATRSGPSVTSSTRVVRSEAGSSAMPRRR